MVGRHKDAYYNNFPVKIYLDQNSMDLDTMFPRDEVNMELHQSLYVMEFYNPLKI